MTAALLFLKSYWKFIALALAIAAVAYSINSYIDSVYDKGVEAGVAQENKVWLDREDKRIQEQTDAIDALEKTAKDLAEARQKVLEARDAKIAELDKKLEASASKLNKIIYTKEGTPQPVCPGATELYLGKSFSELWNAYNLEVLQ